MKKKILCIGIVSLFLLLSFSSIQALELKEKSNVVKSDSNEIRVFVHESGKLGYLFPIKKAAVKLKDGNENIIDDGGKTDRNGNYYFDDIENGLECYVVASHKNVNNGQEKSVRVQWFQGGGRADIPLGLKDSININLIKLKPFLSNLFEKMPLIQQLLSI